METKICKICREIKLDQMDYMVFWSTAYGGYRYKSICRVCFKAGRISGKRGRPKGHRVPDKVKQKISKSRTGSTQTIETRNKISDSIIDWWNKRLPVSEEMLNQYRKFDGTGEITKFIEANKELLNNDEYFYSERRLGSIERRSINLGECDGAVSGNVANPEEILLIKEDMGRRKYY